MGCNQEFIEDIKITLLRQMHDEFQKMKVSMTESFRSLEATVNHMVEIVRMMKDGDGTASRSSQTVSSYPILSIVQSKTSPPKRRRARSTRISHQHHTFWSKRRHIPKRKRKKISPKKKRKKTMQTKRRKQQQEIKSTSRAGPIKLKAGSKQQNLGLLVNRFERKSMKNAQKDFKVLNCDLSLSATWINQINY
ncbi:hypothetical protein Bca52824_064304 [Brassica carinata]|uniref:Uncharacterized protein n=1 Tax=Brassica carinata TaxID=52824 RepID=A0A8X7QG34_BRACI|nr:hypothetical protein Bca52824_064304 [Brassica carinata]